MRRDVTTHYRFMAVGLVMAAAVCLSAPPPAAAQDFRGHSSTLVRYLEVRPLGRDTVPRSQVTEGPDGSLEYQGRPVTCIGDRCVFFVSRSEERTALLTEDVRFTSWGFGVRGLSATVHARGREGLAGDFDWPRSEDRFDLLTGYVELAREEFDVRLGRQRARSGLGFSSYDGLSVEGDPLDWLSVEAYGGRSLARGLHDPRHEVLEGLTSFLPDRNAYLLGAAARFEPVARATIRARYQREIWSDRSALVSERASIDASTGLFRPFSVEASVDWDVGFDRLGKSRVSISYPAADGDLLFEAAGRHYVPYFEMWTIWGFFSPVGYDEVQGRVRWVVEPDLSVWGAAGRRWYGEANVSGFGSPLTDAGWRASAGGRWRPGVISLEGSYRVEKTPGAFLSSAHLAARWSRGEWLDVSLHGSASQQIEEYRVGEGMVAGGGADASVEIVPSLSVSGGVEMYRRFFDNRPSAVDWNQLRAWTQVRVGVGGDPGLDAGALP